MFKIDRPTITKQLEKEIYLSTRKRGTFSCFEVTIGFGRNRERVDYLTYDTKGIWRCYEIKSSIEDYRSEAAHTFVGNYNYYVMPEELYGQVKEEVPLHIGVIVKGRCKKKPKKQELQVCEDVLKYSMIRSLSRYFQRYTEKNIRN